MCANNLCCWPCRLLLESEWEAAAGGRWAEPIEEKTPRYPWQTKPAKMTDEEIQKHANTDEFGFETTSPVGLYPSGASPSGVQELAGNVWEWQANFGDEDNDALTQRGGAWNNNHRNARVANRNRNNPHNRLYDVGLRVVVAHVPQCFWPVMRSVHGQPPQPPTRDSAVASGPMTKHRANIKLARRLWYTRPAPRWNVAAGHSHWYENIFTALPNFVQF